MTPSTCARGRSGSSLNSVIDCGLCHAARACVRTQSHANTRAKTRAPGWPLRVHTSGCAREKYAARDMPRYALRPRAARRAPRLPPVHRHQHEKKLRVCHCDARGQEITTHSPCEARAAGRPLHASAEHLPIARGRDRAMPEVHARTTARHAAWRLPRVHWCWHDKKRRVVTVKAGWPIFRVWRALGAGDGGVAVRLGSQLRHGQALALRRISTTIYFGPRPLSGLGGFVVVLSRCSLRLRHRRPGLHGTNTAPHRRQGF